LYGTGVDGSGGGTPIDAADLNDIEQGITDAHRMPAVRAFRTTNQSITSSTITAVSFDSETGGFDQVGGVASTMHDNSTNPSRLTALYAGIYLAYATVVWAGNATGSRFQWFAINTAGAGTGTRHGQTIAPGNAASTALNNTALMSLAVNDYIELMVFQSSGGALNVLTGDGCPQFAMVRLA